MVVDPISISALTLALITMVTQIVKIIFDHSDGDVNICTRTSTTSEIELHDHPKKHRDRHN